jgi:hypothetical protein
LNERSYLLRCRAFYDDPSICGCDLVLWVEVLEHIPLAILCTRMAMLIIKDFYTKMMIGNQEAFLGGTESQHRDISLKGSYSLKFVEDILIWLISKLGILRTALLVLTPVYINQVIDVSLSFSHIHDMAGILYKDRACFELIYQKISFVKTAVFVYLGIVLSFVIVPVIRLKDNLFIGLELRLLLIGCIAVVVLFTTQFDFETFTKVGTQTPTWFILMAFVVIPFIVFVQTTLPVIHAIVHERTMKRSPNSSILNSGHTAQKRSLQTLEEELNSIRRSLQGRNMFIQFLEAEFSVENLLFVEACEKFEHVTQSSPEQGKALSVLIQETYILTTSPSSVNIPHSIRQATITKLQTLEGDVSLAPELFQAAKDCVQKMIIYDSFSRFRLTKEYRSTFQDTEIKLI